MGKIRALGRRALRVYETSKDPKAKARARRSMVRIARLMKKRKGVGQALKYIKRTW